MYRVAPRAAGGRTISTDIDILVTATIITNRNSSTVSVTIAPQECIIPEAQIAVCQCRYKGIRTARKARSRFL